MNKRALRLSLLCSLAMNAEINCMKVIVTYKSRTLLMPVKSGADPKRLELKSLLKKGKMKKEIINECAVTTNKRIH